MHHFIGPAIAALVMGVWMGAAHDAQMEELRAQYERDLTETLAQLRKCEAREGSIGAELERWGR